MSAIDIDGVSRRFGDVVALHDLDMTVERGEVFGFLGPNGAGKSTTIDLLLDYLAPTTGTVRVLGHDAQAEPVAVRRKMGILPEGFSPMETTTGREHVQFAVDARRADDDPDEILERVGLDGVGDRLASEYSKGMAQRLALGMALVDDPDLLVLDEPSTGLDPHGVRRMREIVRAERDRGATVFFSSHILEQVEAVADRVGILRSGELIAVDSIDDLQESVGTEAQISVALDREPADVESTVEAVDDVSLIDVENEVVTVACPDHRKIDVIDALRVDGVQIRDIETTDPTLEDLFVARTGGVA